RNSCRAQELCRRLRLMNTNVWRFAPGPIKKARSVCRDLFVHRSLVANPLAALRFFASRDAKRSARFRYGSLRFISRRTDWVGVNEVLLDQEYRDVVDTVKGRPSPVVFDLGANIGTFALYVLSRHSDARVYSVEPAAETFDV